MQQVNNNSVKRCERLGAKVTPPLDVGGLWTVSFGEVIGTGDTRYAATDQFLAALAKYLDGQIAAVRERM